MEQFILCKTKQNKVRLPTKAPNEASVVTDVQLDKISVVPDTHV